MVCMPWYSRDSPKSATFTQPSPSTSRLPLFRSLQEQTQPAHTTVSSVATLPTQLFTVCVSMRGTARLWVQQRAGQAVTCSRTRQPDKPLLQHKTRRGNTASSCKSPRVLPHHESSDALRYITATLRMQRTCAERSWRVSAPCLALRPAASPLPPPRTGSSQESAAAHTASPWSSTCSTQRKATSASCKRGMTRINMDHCRQGSAHKSTYIRVRVTPCCEDAHRAVCWC
jgi:hypothetical protein